MKNKFFLTLLGFFIAGNLQAQTLQSISPPSGTAGNTLTALITASGAQFMTASPPGVGNIYLGTNCNSISGSNINVVDDDHVNVDFTIPANALNGIYNLNFHSNAYGLLNLNGSFIISGGVTESIQSVSPTVLNAGTTTTVLVSGQNIQAMIASGNFVVNIFSGSHSVSGSNISVVDSNHINVDFELVPYSTNGLYNFVVTSNSGCFTLSNAITIQGGHPRAVVSISPNQGSAGSSLTAVITGQYLYFMSGSATSPSNMYLQGYGCAGNIPVVLDSAIDNDHVSVHFTIPSGAINGWYNLHVMVTDTLSNSTHYYLHNGFEITGGIDRGIVSINPYHGSRGESLAAIITAQDVHFMTGTTQMIYINFSNGSSVNFSVPLSNSSVIDSDHVNTTIPIPFNVPGGLYDMTLSYQGCSYQLLQGFEVTGNVISGEVYFDIDSNGVLNGGEYGLPGKHVMLLPDSIVSITDNNGNYHFAVDSGSYSVQYLPDANWPLASSPPVYNVAVTYSDTSGLNFGINPIVDEYNMVATITGGFPRCFHHINYQITYTNFSTVVTNGTIATTLDSDLTFISSVPPPDSINGYTYIWNYTNMLLNETRNIVMSVQIPATPGTILNSSLTATIDTNSSVAFSSSDTLNQIVSCSFDPNDKTVVPPGVSNLHYTLLSDTLQYLIRFQNTGNDTVFRVIVRDTLNNSLDINSLYVLASSHPVQTIIHSNHAVEFRFENIMLPDSLVDEIHSHGFVKFSIHTLPGTPSNTVVTNSAGIYFDLNDVVLTNSVFNTMVTSIPSVVNEISAKPNSLLVYPNPFSDEAIVVFHNEESRKFSLKIIDEIGRVVEQQVVYSDQAIIRRNNLASGIYLILLEDSNGTAIVTGKFSIE